MKQTRTFWVLGVIVGLLALPVFAQESDNETSLLKRAAKVDKPIADTYEPLNSTYVGDGDRLNNNIEQSWQLKEQAREREQAAVDAANSKERAELERRIQEPGEPVTPQAGPVVESTDGSLSIRETQ